MKSILTGKLEEGENLDERIRAQDIIGSVDFDDGYFERADDFIKIGFWVESRSGGRKEPYGVGLYFKRKEEAKNEYGIVTGETLHYARNIRIG